MMPLCTMATAPSQSVCGCAFSTVGAPCVAQRVWAIPPQQGPRAGSSFGVLAPVIRPTWRKSWSRSSQAKAMPQESYPRYSSLFRLSRSKPVLARGPTYPKIPHMEGFYLINILPLRIDVPWLAQRPAVVGVTSTHGPVPVVEEGFPGTVAPGTELQMDHGAALRFLRQPNQLHVRLPRSPPAFALVAFRAGADQIRPLVGSPWVRGMTWSRLNSLLGKRYPQYWHRFSSRANRLRRLISSAGAAACRSRAAGSRAAPGSQRHRPDPIVGLIALRKEFAILRDLAPALEVERLVAFLGDVDDFGDFLAQQRECGGQGRRAAP